MPLQFKSVQQAAPQQPAQQAPQQPQVQTAVMGIPMAPLGTPLGIPHNTLVNKPPPPRQPTPIQMPGEGLDRSLFYYADYGGCGFWRMIWPQTLLNGYQRSIINGLTSMVVDPNFYSGLKAVKLQRQATPEQLEFTKFLKNVSQQHGAKVIYEIDDIIFRDDIPDFNRCKEAFEDPKIVESILSMMRLSDEITVTCPFMKEYYKERTGNQNITVIPNYAPRFWMDRFYNKNEISRNFEKNKKRPRVGYCGSGTHIDVANKTNQVDDFSHIVNYIIATRKKFQWVLMGCFPLPLKPFVDSGEIEFHQWSMIYDYPKAIYDLKLNCVIAPLMPCAFNRAKSNIKYLESACLGIPGVFQDICTYGMAPQRFTNGDELIAQLEKLTKDASYYMKMSKECRAYAETMWLEDHLDEHMNALYTPYGSPERCSELIKNNPEQSKE